MRTNERPTAARDARSRAEELVLHVVTESSNELVALACELIACDTTAREPGEGPREEERLQRILAGRLQAIGADVDLWEAEPIAPGHPFGITPGLDFRGRPQLGARVAGTGGGRSLLLNGHVFQRTHNLNLIQASKFIIQQSAFIIHHSPAMLANFLLHLHPASIKTHAESCKRPTAMPSSEASAPSATD